MAARREVAKHKRSVQWAVYSVECSVCNVHYSVGNFYCSVCGAVEHTALAYSLGEIIQLPEVTAASSRDCRTWPWTVDMTLAHLETVHCTVEWPLSAVHRVFPNNNTWWSITWFYSRHQFLLKTQSMVLDPSGVNCIRLLDGNRLCDSKTLHRAHWFEFKASLTFLCFTCWAQNIRPSKTTFKHNVSKSYSPASC